MLNLTVFNKVQAVINMSKRKNKKGSVLLISVFVSALFGAMLIGMMQLNTEEAMLAANYIELTKALAIAQAGLDDAYYEIRQNRTWTTGFTDKAFGGGSYSVTVTVIDAGPSTGAGESIDFPPTPRTLGLVATGVTQAGYKARIDADITVDNSSTASYITISEVRIND